MEKWVDCAGYDGPERRAHRRRCSDCPVDDDEFHCNAHEANQATLDGLKGADVSRKTTAKWLIGTLVPVSLVLVAFGWNLAVKVETLALVIKSQGEDLAEVAGLVKTIAVIDTRQQDVLRRLSDIEGKVRR